MSHDWKPSNPHGQPIEDTCTKCKLTRTSMFYSNIPGSDDRFSKQVISIEKGELDCDEMVLRRVMLS